MATSKLHYSKLRNGQKKNKSINEERDFMSNELDNYNNMNVGQEDSPLNGSKPNKGKENKNEELFKVFGDTVNAGNLDYLNNLLKNKCNIDNHINNLDKANAKKKKGHIRYKSTITVSQTKNTLKSSPQKYNEQISNPSTDISHTPSMKRDINPDILEIDSKNLSIDENVLKLNNGTSVNGIQTIINGFSNIISNDNIDDRREGGSDDDKEEEEGDNTPTLAIRHDCQERLFDQYFKNISNGDINTNNNISVYSKRISSLEEIRECKEPIVNPNQSTTVFYPNDQIFRNSLSSGINPISHTNNNNIKQESFMINIDQYIDYFTKSENTNSQRSLKNQEFFINNSGNGSNSKLSKTFQKELLASQNENKRLRQYIDQLILQLKELLLYKNKLIDEIKEYKLREEETKKKIRVLEQKNKKLAQKNEEYKCRLQHTQELLAKEKIDNENNLFALKKVLYSKINNTIDNKVLNYKDKNIRDKEQLLNTIYMIKKDKDDLNKSKYRNKEHLYMESGFGSTYFKNIRNGAQDRLSYDIPSNFLSPKIDPPSEDEEISSSSLHSSTDLERSYEQEALKNVSKEQEIKYLQDRLYELTDHSEAHYYYNNNIILKEGKSSTRNKSKSKYKNNEFTSTFKHGNGIGGGGSEARFYYQSSKKKSKKFSFSSQNSKNNTNDRQKCE